MVEQANDPLAQAVPCRRCGYDLRGMPADGRCPECGAAVAAALDRGSVAQADPRWIRAVAAGVMLFATGSVVVGVYAATRPVVQMFLGEAIVYPLAGGRVLWAGAAVLITKPEVGHTGGERRRALVVAALGLWALHNSAVALELMPSGWGSMGWAAAMVLIHFVVGAMGLTALMVLVGHVSGIAAGMPDGRLAGWMRKSGRVYGLLLGVLLGLNLLMNVYGYALGAPMAWRDWIVGVVSLTDLLAVFAGIAAIGMAGVAVGIGRRLRRLAGAASQ